MELFVRLHGVGELFRGNDTHCGLITMVELYAS